jgi:hypothetical protein
LKEHKNDKRGRREKGRMRKERNGESCELLKNRKRLNEKGRKKLLKKQQKKEKREKRKRLKIQGENRKKRNHKWSK